MEYFWRLWYFYSLSFALCFDKGHTGNCNFLRYQTTVVGKMFLHLGFCFNGNQLVLSL